MAWSRRTLLTRALAAFAAMAVAAAACLGWVDAEPYMESAPYRRTIQSLAGVFDGPTGEAAPVRVGFGRGSLIHGPGAPSLAAWPLAGYGQRDGAPASGVRDDVFARALVIEAAGRRRAVVSLDALIMPRNVVERLEPMLPSLGLSPNDVFYSATHTHSGPGAWGEGWAGEAFAGSFDERVPAWLAERTRAALVQATEDLAKANFGWGRRACPDLARNRLVGDEGAIDDLLTIAAFRRADKPLIIVGAFGAHATIVGADNLKVSGGYPGAWARRVEERLEAQAMFLAGAVGSQSAAAPSGDFAGAEAFADALADRSVSLVEGLSWADRAEVASARLAVGLPEPSLRLTRRLRLRPWLVRRLTPFPSETYLQILRIDGLTWLGTPCDISGEIAVRARALFERAHSGAGLALTSFNGDYIGYVTPSKYYSLNEYETRTMGFYGPAAGDYFLDLIVRFAGAANR